MKRFNLDESVVCEVHDTLGGQDTRLGKIVGESQRSLAHGAVQWVVPVTSRTVYRIGSISQLASDEGCAIIFELRADLNERQMAFFEDFQRHCLARGVAVGALFSELPSDALILIRELLLAVGRSLWFPHRETATDRDCFGKAVLIGAYGGDHVGDAAILGGVLQSLHTRYGTQAAYVLSHRPEHTRRLAGGLETPVSLTVLPYQSRYVNRLLESTDVLILAGGPLMDLPRVLVKHLSVALRAERKGVPLLIKSVGIGPFKRRLSRWMARRVANSARRISIRTAKGSEDPILQGLKIDLSSDPAFTYLPTRSVLNLVDETEERSATALLAGTENRLRVGINLRPIRHIWSLAGADYSKVVEARFMEKFAAGLVALSAELSRPVSYVFYPMNSIQFGQSDLTAAYRLHCLVGAAVDLRVWETDPTVDGILMLLRRLDVVVAMRFHACIFALTQQLPVLGIDYYPGQGGKVEELFSDLNRAADVRRMDTFDQAWFVERMRKHLSKALLTSSNEA